MLGMDKRTAGIMMRQGKWGTVLLLQLQQPKTTSSFAGDKSASYQAGMHVARGDDDGASSLQIFLCILSPCGVTSGLSGMAMAVPAIERCCQVSATTPVRIPKLDVFVGSFA